MQQPSSLVQGKSAREEEREKSTSMQYTSPVPTRNERDRLYGVFMPTYCTVRTRNTSSCTTRVLRTNSIVLL
ncbi:hypothetical protein LX32DRAFT_633343, partial [Colletotrichum zoysiae]